MSGICSAHQHHEKGCRLCEAEGGRDDMVMPRETILLGASNVCSDCGVKVIPKVMSSPAGYYVGTSCKCGPYSRESGYYETEGQALAALQNGDYGR